MITHHNKIEMMIEEGFLYNLPEYIDQFIVNDIISRSSGGDDAISEYSCEEWGLWGDWEEVLERDNDDQAIDGSGFPGSEYRFIPPLWNWFIFWKDIKNKNVKDNYLLGEILWYLIWFGSMDEILYNENINHKKEKGIETTTFLGAKQQLKLTNGKCWIKAAQKEYGDIIQENNKSIHFSPTWINLLDIKHYKYGLKVNI